MHYNTKPKKKKKKKIRALLHAQSTCDVSSLLNDLKVLYFMYNFKLQKLAI